MDQLIQIQHGSEYEADQSYPTIIFINLHQQLLISVNLDMNTNLH